MVPEGGARKYLGGQVPVQTSVACGEQGHTVHDVSVIHQLVILSWCLVWML